MRKRWKIHSHLLPSLFFFFSNISCFVVVSRFYCRPILTMLDIPRRRTLGLHMSNGVSDNYTLCILVCYNARVREFEGCELVALSFSSSFFTLHSSVVEFQDIDFFHSLLLLPHASLFIFSSLSSRHSEFPHWVKRENFSNSSKIFFGVVYEWTSRELSLWWCKSKFDGSEINLLFLTLVLFFFHSRDAIFPLSNARTNGARKRKGIIEKAQTQID